MNKHNTHSFYLFNKPSFARGIGRLWDFRGLLNSYNNAGSGSAADSKALYTDWLMVGQDMKQAIKVFEKEDGR